VPQKITIDKSGANTAAIDAMRADSGADIELRQWKTSTTSSSRTTGPSNASCDPCSVLLAGIETMHMIKKGQLDRSKAQASSAASQFYSLASDLGG